jgi:hypothetical protein
MLPALGTWLVPATGLAQLPNAVGRVVAVFGVAQVVRPTGAAVLFVDGQIYESDTIKTGADGKVRIVCFGGVTVTVGPSTEARIDRFVTSKTAGLSSAFALLSGIIRLVGGALAGPTEITVETPNALAAVRSTDWLVQRTASSTAVFVEEGTVAVRSKAGGEVTLADREGTDVPDGEMPRPPRIWGEARRQTVLALTTL